MSTWVCSGSSIKVHPRISEDLRKRIEIGPWVVDSEFDRKEANAAADESVLGLIGETEISYGCFHFAPDALARILSTYLLPAGYRVNGFASISADDLKEEYTFDVVDGSIEWNVSSLNVSALRKHLMRAGGMDEEEASETIWDNPFGFEDKWYEKSIGDLPAIRENNALAAALRSAKSTKRKVSSGKELGAFVSGLIAAGLESQVREFWSNNGKCLAKLDAKEWVDYLTFVDLGDSRVPLCRQLLRWGAEYIPTELIWKTLKLRKRLTGAGLTLIATQNFEQNFEPQEDDASRLSGAEWTYLLRMSDDFDRSCKWGALNSRDWSSILAIRPDLCDYWVKYYGSDPVENTFWWNRLSEKDWCYLIAAQPKLKKYRSANYQARKAAESKCLPE